MESGLAWLCNGACCAAFCMTHGVVEVLLLLRNPFHNGSHLVSYLLPAACCQLHHWISATVSVVHFSSTWH